MSWQRRLLEIGLAGGLTLPGCVPFGQTCNANPDPCCSAPDSQACANAKLAREDMAQLRDMTTTVDPDLAPGANVDGGNDAAGDGGGCGRDGGCPDGGHGD